MIEDQFGLTGRPFALTPDPDFWFESATHKKAMSYLRYGLSLGDGFIVVTGEVGAGKTTLARRLVETIDADRLRAVTLVSTQLGPDDTLRAVAAELGVGAPDKAGLLVAIQGALNAEARDGRRVLLIVDEAQNLPREAVEELRMLSNFQLGPDPLVQILLLGQPEFRDRLASDPALEQVRQRVIATHHLGPLEADEVGPYLIHRLSAVGWTGRPDFTDGAVAAIDDWTGGLPRQVNTLASRILLAAAMAQAEVIDAELVAEVTADLERDAPVVVATAPGDATPPTGSSEVRLRRLEAQVEAQDMALRHVLKLLVEWMEAEPEPVSVEPSPVEPAPAGRLRGVA